MQSFSSRIWTWVAVSISYDDNHYTTGTSYVSSPLLIYLSIYLHDRSVNYSCQFFLYLSVYQSKLACVPSLSSSFPHPSLSFSIHLSISINMCHSSPPLPLSLSIYLSIYLTEMSFTYVSFFISIYKCPDFDIKQSDGAAPAILDLWGIQCTPSLPTLPDPL